MPEASSIDTIYRGDKYKNLEDFTFQDLYILFRMNHQLLGFS